MKNKPWLIYLITIGLILVPFVFLANVWVKSDSLKAQISPVSILLFASLSLVSFVTALGVWRVKLWGFYSLVILGGATTVLDLYTWNLQNFTFNWWIVLDLSAVVAGLSLIVQENVRKPYFNPKIKWWETAERIRVDVPATVYTEDKESKVLILDVSQSGCFSDFELPLQVGQSVKIDIHHKSIKFQSEAIVARKSDNPRGYGLKFTNTNRDNKKQMNKIIHDLSSAL